jgi:hypothetical protein
VLRIVPAPRATGDATFLVPPAPFFMRWQQNVTVFGRAHAHALEDEGVTVEIPEVYQDVLVFDAVSTLAAENGDYMDLAVSAVARELARLWRKQLGAL